MWTYGGLAAQEAVARQAEALGAETLRRLQGTRPKAYLHPSDHLGTLSWLRCIADQTGLSRPIELQRRFDPRCFYVSKDGRVKSSCKWAPICRLERKPSAAVLALVERELAGTTAAFKDCLIGFWHFDWVHQEQLLRIRSNLATPHLKVLGIADGGGPVPVVRDTLRECDVRYLMACGTTDSLALLSAYLLVASIRKEDAGYVRRLAECVYRYFLGLSLEPFRRGIAHDLFVAMMARVFALVRVDGCSPCMDACAWCDDVCLYNVLPYSAFAGPPARGWSERQEQMARIALGDVHPRAALAFSLLWLPREVSMNLEDHPRVIATFSDRVRGRMEIQRSLTRLFSRPSPWTEHVYRRQATAAHAGGFE